MRLYSLSAIRRKITDIFIITSLKLKYGKRIQIPRSVRLRGQASLSQNGRLRFGRKTTVLPGTVFTARGGQIELGDRVFFNRNCIVACHQKITIGAQTFFGPNVLIYDHDHLFDHEGLCPVGFKTGEVSIGQKCWIGGNAVILRGTKIGDGCVIGAGAVVKGEIPPHSLVIANRETIVKPIEKRD